VYPWLKTLGHTLVVDETSTDQLPMRSKLSSLRESATTLTLPGYIFVSPKRTGGGSALLSREIPQEVNDDLLLL
jgi:hypothetical protein